MRARLIILICIIIFGVLVLPSCGESKETDTEKEKETTESTDTKSDSDDIEETDSEDIEESDSEDTDSEGDEDIGDTDSEEPVVETDDEYDQDESQDSETQEDLVDSDMPDGEESDGDTDTEADTDTETETETESETETDDVIDLGPRPVDKDLTIISEGASEYVIVYERGNVAQSVYSESLSEHIKEKYGVEIPYYQFGDTPSRRTKRIIIGNADLNAKFAQSDIKKAVDFTVDVLDDDLILYASTEYMYKYMLEIVKSEILTGGEGLSFPASWQYIFSRDSEYKDLNYAQYYKLKNGNFTKDTILDIFEAKTFTEYGSLPYRIYVPSDYDASKEYPLLTILHGAGERGNDNKNQLINMVPEMFNQEGSKYMDAIIICPQCPSHPNQWVDTPWTDGNYSISSVGESDELKAVVALVTKARKELSVDSNRVLVMGLSMGGFGTWDLLMRHSDIFTRAVCLCGGGDPSQAEKLINIPIWAVHSSNDGIVPYEGTKEMCEAIKNAGGELCIFETKESKHNVWTYAGESTEIANWLFE